ncbi:MAG: LutB/LldF family L-lactate oxidation iron-sulfur protein [Pseudomonadota bacterium]
MQISSMHFKANASIKLKDSTLQQAMLKAKGKFVDGRAAAVQELGNFEEIREAGKSIRNRALENLDVWLLRFEQEAMARGAVVHWAQTGEEVNRIVLDIARQYGVKKVVKSKSMVSEECALNPALENAGIQVVETDLGEYILQLAHEPPSHIIAPAVHKTREEVADLFVAAHHTERKTDPTALAHEAREVLRPHFLDADMGISGANFLIAETGSTVVVSNEGNGRMVTTLPRVHVAITGVEKVVPTLEDFSTLLRLLTRSATGQPISNYVSLTTGTRSADDPEAPEHFHIILVDSGRTKLLGTELQSALRCIRCGACMNHCPVYQNVGGHAYGWVYPGPIGSVLTPVYIGLENALDLPQAATLCNECGVVCPVKIPLPDLMRVLREKQFEGGMRPWTERLSMKAWRWTALHPRAYALLSKLGAKFLQILGGREKMLHKLPGLDGWTDGRDMPAPAGETFRAAYARYKREASE